MDLSTFYRWMGVSSTALCDANEANKDVALAAWNELSSFTLLFFVGMLIISIGLAVYYYTAYNNQPGRHYTPACWGISYAWSVIIVFIITLAMAFTVVKSYDLNGLWKIEFGLAIANALYAAFCYLIVSFMWCNIQQLPTNAYRFLKL